MLLSYTDALARILGATEPLTRGSAPYPLASAGPIRVLAESIVAADAHPRFDNASVDGYAFHADDIGRVGVRLPVGMTVPTGVSPSKALEPGRAARIFTGACLPVGTSAVAMQEDVEALDGSVTLREPLERGDGLRRAGSDFAAGDRLLEAGAPLTPGVTGLLSAQGIVMPKVAALPTCVIITTGDEIVPPDVAPGPNQLRDSIGLTLTSAASRYATTRVAFSRDDYDRLRDELSRAASEADAVFVAGGASVGDRDFVSRVVASLGSVEFHGISIRPGKPLLFGKIDGKPILCLPGNPASAYVCFHLFGVPLLRRLGGWSNPEHLWFPIGYGADHEPESREVFARVTLTGGLATPVHEQASFGLRSLGSARALARLPASTAVSFGDSVQITLL